MGCSKWPKNGLMHQHFRPRNHWNWKYILYVVICIVCICFVIFTTLFVYVSIYLSHFFCKGKDVDIAKGKGGLARAGERTFWLEMIAVLLRRRSAYWHLSLSFRYSSTMLEQSEHTEEQTGNTSFRLPTSCLCSSLK